MTAYVYMIRCANGHLYTGWTNDLAARLEAHRSGRGARYTRSFRAVSLVYYETVADRSEALRREYAIKHLSKAEKEAMVHLAGMVVLFGFMIFITFKDIMKLFG